MKKFVALVLCILMLCTVASAEMNLLEELDIVQGRGDSMAEEEYLTRSEALTLIWRTTGIAFNDLAWETDPFEDIEGHWAYDTIIKFHMAGLVDGTSETTFDPDRNIKNDEFLKILLSALGYENVTLDNVYDVAKSAGIKKVLVSSDYIFRSEAFQYCINALSGKAADGALLWKKFASENPEKAEILENVFNVELTFADKLNANMPKDENYMISPFSVKMALAMAANGSEGETLKEITDTIDVEDLDEYNEFAKSMIEKYSKTDIIRLDISNSIWINTSKALFDFTVPFKNTVKTYFNGEVRQVNNSNAVEEINGWVNDKTNGKIPSIIEDNDFYAALINAVYFKAKWADEFNENLTRKDEFTDIKGNKSQIDFMNKTDYFRYAETENARVVSIPYTRSEDKDGEFVVYEDLDISMYVLLPKDGEINPVYEIENADFKSERVRLSLPKFKIEFKQALNDALKNMGMSRSFNSLMAQFGPMTGDDTFYIDEVLHKTYIDVNERETEAAAVTAILMKGGSAAQPKDPIEFKADRPFSFVIRDNTNGEILFMGEYSLAE